MEILRDPNITPLKVSRQDRYDVIKSCRLYKMYDKLGNLLYIGKSNNVGKRMTYHFSNREYRLWKGDVSYIMATSSMSEADMNIIEPYLIAIHKPLQNIEFKTDSVPTFTLPEPLFPHRLEGWEEFKEQL